MYTQYFSSFSYNCFPSLPFLQSFIAIIYLHYCMHFKCRSIVSNSHFSFRNEQLTNCQLLQPGKSTLASIRTVKEQETLVTVFGGGWISGEKSSSGKWFWRSLNGPVEITQFFWEEGMPSFSGSCMGLTSDNTGTSGWEDWMCPTMMTAICEMRC